MSLEPDLGAAPTDDLSKFPYFCFDDEAQKVFIEWSEDLHWERMGNETSRSFAASSQVRQALPCVGPHFPPRRLHFEGSLRPGKPRSGRARGSLVRVSRSPCEKVLRLAQGRWVAGRAGAGSQVGTRGTRRRLHGARCPAQQWRHLTKNEAIQAALDWLEDEDWLRGETTGGTGPGSGRRTVRHHIHPAVTGKREGGGA